MTTTKLPKITDPDLLAKAHPSRESWHAFEIMAEIVYATERLRVSRLAHPTPSPFARLEQQVQQMA